MGLWRVLTRGMVALISVTVAEPRATYHNCVQGDGSALRLIRLDNPGPSA